MLRKNYVLPGFALLLGLALLLNSHLQSEPQPGLPTSLSDFEKISEITVGSHPHGMKTYDGYLYLAASGADFIEVINLETMVIEKRWPVAGVPLDLVRAGDGWLVSLFQGEELVYLDGESGLERERFTVGKGPSLFINEAKGAEGSRKSYIVSELADQFSEIDLSNPSLSKVYDTGLRPYPGDVTQDGRLGFVPNRDDGSVSIFDLLSGQTLRKIEVCTSPLGGSLTRDDVEYIVACGGDDSLVFINTASFEVTHTVSSGIGKRPFSVAVSEDGRFAFTNHSGGAGVSIVDLANHTVIGQLETGDAPIVLRVFAGHLYVSSENSNLLSVFKLPAPPQKNASGEKNQLLVMGMIHDGHMTSEEYGLDKVRAIIKQFDPDYVLTEIPPNRLQAALEGYASDGVVSEPRVAVFPEYRDLLIPLTSEMNFEIVPTAAWTSEMNNYRRSAMQLTTNDPAWDQARQENTRLSRIMRDGFQGRGNNPEFIHTDAYDTMTKEGLAAYDKYYNEVLGLGGWSNINAGHYALIEKALEQRSGEGARILLMFGSSHKYWFLEQLRLRGDINLVDMQAVLSQLP